MYSFNHRSISFHNWLTTIIESPPFIAKTHREKNPSNDSKLLSARKSARQTRVSRRSLFPPLTIITTSSSTVTYTISAQTRQIIRGPISRCPGIGTAQSCVYIIQRPGGGRRVRGARHHADTTQVAPALQPLCSAPQLSGLIDLSHPVKIMIAALPPAPESQCPTDSSSE